MKHFSKLLLAIIALLSCQVAQAQNNLVVFTEGLERVWVYVNGALQNQYPESNILIEGLRTQATYKIKVVFEEKALGELSSNMGFQEESTEGTLMITKNKKGAYVIRYRGEAPIPATHPANQHTHTFTTQSVQMMTGTDPNLNGTGVGVNMNVNDGQNGTGGVKMGFNVNDGEGGNVSFNFDVKFDDGMGNGTGTNQNMQTNPNNQNNNNNINSNNQKTQNNCFTPMSSSDFNKLVSSISQKSFEDDKLKIARQGTQAACLSVNQVKSIMDLFSFEDTKLAFAKFAYPYTTDKKNYYQINDAFTFSASSDELDKFLNSQR